MVDGKAPSPEDAARVWSRKYRWKVEKPHPRGPEGLDSHGEQPGFLLIGHHESFKNSRAWVHDLPRRPGEKRKERIGEREENKA